MTVSIYEHAVLANDAYIDRSKDINKTKVTIDDVDYKIINTFSNSRTGYQGTAYRREDTGEVVIAHRGTESIKDGLTDANMAISGVSDQLNDAMAFTQHAMEEAKKWAELKHQPLSISITGHSLGGFLTEATAAKFGLPADTFNSYYGAVDIQAMRAHGVDVNRPYPNIVNHARATDVASATGPHLGPVRLYAPPEDIELLRQGRYVDSDSDGALPANPLLSVTIDAHKMGNFLSRNPITGETILRPIDEVRAHNFREPIERYRQDVLQGRLDLSVAANRRPSLLPQRDPDDPGQRLGMQVRDAGMTITRHAAGQAQRQDRQLICAP